MKKKKLLITSDTFAPRIDGVSVFLKQLIPHLAKTFDITVIAPKYPGRMPSLPCKVILVPLGHIELGDYTPPQFRTGLVSKHVKQADLVYNQNFGPIGMSAMIAAHLHKKPLAAYIFSVQWELFAHSIGKGKKVIEATTKQAVKFFYNKVDLLIVPAKNVKKAFTRIGVRVKKIIIPIRINLKNFTPPRSKAQVKARLGLTNKFVYGYVGRLAREKDLPTLCKAFRQLAKKYPDVVLLMVGKGLPLKGCKHPRIILAGQKINVTPYYQSMDAFILPSLTETCSLSTEEAMASGVPPITTAVGWLQEYIKPKKNGLFFNMGDAQDLANKMELVYINKKLRLAMGKAARKTALKLFDIKKSFIQITKALTSLC